MNESQTIDIHAHILIEEAMSLLRREAPEIAPRLSPIDADSAVLDVAGTPYRPFPRGGWDLERRLADMNMTGVDVQVVSVLPQTFLYNQDAALTATFAAIQNDAIAKLVSEHPTRFVGLATLPMQAPDLAAAELRRAVRDLGLRGAMIGSNIEGRNLDDPTLEPVWEMAAQLGAFLLIHPVKVAGSDRLKSYYLVNLIGNPLDTSIAAASLVFSGVLARHPSLRICLSHGGGFIPYQAGRMIHGWQVRPEPKKSLGESPRESLSRFYYDSILHSAPALEFLITSVGTSQVLLGSDYPFDMGMPDCASHVRSLPIPAADRARVLGGTAALLGLRPADLGPQSG